MKIKSLTLYKTELDAQYTNVIDGGRDDSYNLSTLKTDIFDAFFSPYVIYNSNNIKSVKETDGVCVISIGKEYEDILSDGYNYAIINTGKKNIYYFIVGMESLNDGPTPSMFITLERDAWCNNIAYFTNHIEDDANNVVRSHFNRWYGSNGKYYPYYYNSDDGTEFTPVKDEEMLYYGVGGNVVWCGVRFSRDTIVSGNMINGLIGQLKTLFGTKTFKYEIITNLIKNVVAGMEIKTAIESAIDDTEVREGLQQWSETNWKSLNDTSWFGASQYEAANPLFYFPVAIQTGVSDGVPNYNFVFTCNGHSYDFTSTNYIMAAFNFDAEEITDAFLTLIPPFPYTVSGSTITTGTGVGMTNTQLRNSSGTKYIFPYNPGVDFWYIIQCPVSSAHKELNYTYTNELTGIEPKGSIGSKLFNPNASYNDVKLLEPRIYCRPYVDVNVSVGQYKENVPIIYDRTNIKMIVSMGLKSEPNVSLFLNNLLLSAYNAIGSLGKLPTSYDKWKDYVVSQGINMGLAAIGGYNPVRTSTVERTHSAVDTYQHRIKEQYKGTPDDDIVNTTKWDSYKNVGPKSVNSVSKSGGGYRTSSLAGGVINGVGKGLEITGSATQPNMPSILANNNLELQIPRVVVSKWSVERELDDLLANLHLYGYTHGETQSVKHNTRVWWDFCRTESCSLPAITNYRDRQILQDAFNRGITKWHAELSAFGFKNDFSRNCNNIERDYVSAEDAYISYTFTRDGANNQNTGTSGGTNTFTLLTGTLDSNGLNGEGWIGNGTTGKFPSGGAVKSATVHQFRFSALPTTNGHIDYIYAPEGWNQVPYLQYTNGNFKFYTGHGDITIPATDCLNKTITLVLHYPAGSDTGGLAKLYLDKTLISYKQTSYSNSGYNSKVRLNSRGGTIVRYKVYDFAPGATYDDAWVAKHQL